MTDGTKPNWPENVIPLFDDIPVPLPIQPPDERVVALARDILRRAEAGEVRGIAMAMLLRTPTGEQAMSTAFELSPGGYQSSLLGAAHTLANRIYDEIIK